MAQIPVTGLALLPVAVLCPPLLVSHSLFPVVFGYLYLPDRARTVFTLQDLLPQFIPVVFEISQKSIYFIPSTPCAPLFLLTCLYALLRLARLWIRSRSLSLHCWRRCCCFRYPLVSKRSRIPFVFCISLRTALATARFSAFFSPDFGNFHPMYPLYLHMLCPCSLSGFTLICRLIPQHMPDMICVPRVGTLPPAPFRFPLAEDTLALS